METKFVAIKSITQLPDEKTFDITVEGVHELIANNIISHNCIGIYHPHGDTSVYGAMVGMAGVRNTGQKVGWLRKNINEAMIEGRGNFGDHVDGPAAMRYCVVAGTKVMTENGLVNIENIPNWFKSSSDTPEWFSDAAYRATALTTAKHTEAISVKVMSDVGYQTASTWINSGKRSVISLNTKEGYSLTCTRNHPLLVINSAMDFEWKPSGKLKIGDTVCMQRENTLLPHGSKPVLVKSFNSVDNVTLSPELSYILGFVLAKFEYRKNLSVFRENKTDFKQFISYFSKVFGDYSKYFLDTSYPNGIKTTELEIAYQQASKYLNSFVQHENTLIPEPKIPETIFSASQDEVKNFLRGLLDISKIENKAINFVALNVDIAIGVQQLLLNYFGIVSTRNLCSVVIEKEENIERYTEIGFTSTKKVTAFLKLLNVVKTQKVQIGVWDVLKSKVSKQKPFKHIDNVFTSNTPELFNKLSIILSRNYYYATISEIVKHKEHQWVYDLTVPASHAFTANGFVVHNTESKLSTYGETFLLDPDYLAVSSMVPNFSDDNLEPVILPAKIPNLLVNGSEGIAVGVASNIPSFNLDAVRKCAVLALKGLATVKSVQELLSGQFSFAYGGISVNEDGLSGLISDGAGAIVLSPTYKEKDNSLIITSVCPRFNILKSSELIKDIKGTLSVRNETGDEGIKIVCKHQKNLTKPAIDAWFTKVISSIQVKINYSMSATIRQDDGTVVFTSTSILNILNTWSVWRLELEQKVIKFKLTNLRQELLRLKTLLIAINNIDLIVKTVRTKGKPEVLFEDKMITWVKHTLMTKLNITGAQVDIILEMKLRSLEALEEGKMVAKVALIRSEIAELKADFEKPTNRVISDLLKLKA